MMLKLHKIPLVSPSKITQQQYSYLTFKIHFFLESLKDYHVSSFMQYQQSTHSLSNCHVKTFMQYINIPPTHLTWSSNQAD